MRYAVEGIRPGTRIHTPHGVVETHPVDGGAALSEAQASYLRSIGYQLAQRRGPIPPVPGETRDPEEIAEAERDRVETDRLLEKARRETLAPLSKKTHDPKRR